MMSLVLKNRVDSPGKAAADDTMTFGSPKGRECMMAVAIKEPL